MNAFPSNRLDCFAIFKIWYRSLLLYSTSAAKFSLIEIDSFFIVGRVDHTTFRSLYEWKRTMIEGFLMTVPLGSVVLPIMWHCTKLIEFTLISGKFIFWMNIFLTRRLHVLISWLFSSVTPFIIKLSRLLYCSWLSHFRRSFIFSFSTLIHRRRSFFRDLNTPRWHHYTLLTHIN